MRARYCILYAFHGRREVVDTFKTRGEAERCLAEYRAAFSAALAAGALLWLERV